MSKWMPRMRRLGRWIVFKMVLALLAILLPALLLIHHLGKRQPGLRADLVKRGR